MPESFEADLFGNGPDQGEMFSDVDLGEVAKIIGEIIEYQGPGISTEELPLGDTLLN